MYVCVRALAPAHVCGEIILCMSVPRYQTYATYRSTRDSLF